MEINNEITPLKNGPYQQICFTIVWIDKKYSRFSQMSAKYDSWMSCMRWRWSIPKDINKQWYKLSSKCYATYSGRRESEGNIGNNGPSNKETFHCLTTALI